MRLKNADEPLWIRLLRRLQRRCNLCRMMRIVVNDPNTAFFSLRLKAALRSVESREPRGELFKRHTDGKPRHDAGERIEHVVTARDVERDMSQSFVAVPDIKRDARALHRDVLCAIVCRMVDGIGQIFFVDRLYDVPQVFVIHAENSPAAIARVLNELMECLDDVFHRAVMIHVIIFNICHNGDERMQLQKRAVALVRF